MTTLVGLATDAGLEVRVLAGARDGDGDGGPNPTSAVCRVRDRVWVVLSSDDPLSRRVDVLASALRDHARPFLEGRWLPPAVRDRVVGGPDWS